ncbi:MAG: starch-binding protein [Dysgonamonadaceae bacterium]|jgi:alpha-amylase|nr:starch-binding protein [Dysgonamonadaceae bacterium]
MKIYSKTKQGLILILLFLSIGVSKAQVPLATTDVMIQAFAWNSHSQTKWVQLNDQAKELSAYFDLVWLPPSAMGEGGGASNMGYHPYQWSNQISSWGSKSQLQTLIRSLHEGGAKVLADLVLNHRAGKSWVTFTEDNYGAGYTNYQLLSTHICKDDEAKDRAANLDPGLQLSNNYDWNWDHDINTWGGYAAARDLDHNTSYVRSAIKEYMKFLKNEIGYDGWRLDLVKGYDPKFTKEYNNAAGGYLSVGEYYDSNYDALNAWVNATDKTSMVFDFAVHDQLTKWGGGSNYGLLAWQADGVARPAGYMHHPNTRQYAVTFVDNHDTAESHHTGNWSYKGDLAKAYAFLLSSPGIPCVFWEHWVAQKNNIQKMIAARKAVGLNSNSDVKVTNTSGYYESVGTGKCGSLICRIGDWSGEPGNGYTLACSGSGWAYYTKLNTGTPCKTISVDPEKPIGRIQIRFKAPSDWSTVKIWAWDLSNDQTNYTGGVWPGQTMIKDADGYHSITISNITASTIGVVINNGNPETNKAQTGDLSTNKSICWDASSTYTTGDNGVKYYEVTPSSTCKITAINDLYVNASQLLVYPNPAYDQLMLSTYQPVASVEIRSVAGKLVKKATENTISVKDLSEGIYFVTAIYPNGSSQTTKFIKR